MLCQSLNAEFSEKGIHIAHIVIDGMVDADTLGKVLGPELYQKLRKQRGWKMMALFFQRMLWIHIFIFINNTDQHGHMRLILELFLIRLGNH